MFNNVYQPGNGQAYPIQGYRTSAPTQTTSTQAQDAGRQLLGAFAQIKPSAEGEDGFRAMVTPSIGSTKTAGLRNLSVSEWIHEAACNVNKEGFEVDAEDSTTRAKVLYKGKSYVATYGMGLVHNRETGEYLCWSSNLNEPLTVKFLFRKRPKKQDICFAVVFPDGSELTSDDPVDMVIFLVLPKGDTMSALFAAGNGGTEGFGGFGFTTQDGWLRTCASMCVTVSGLLSSKSPQSLANEACGLESSGGADDTEEEWEDDQ